MSNYDIVVFEYDKNTLFMHGELYAKSLKINMILVNKCRVELNAD